MERMPKVSNVQPCKDYKFLVLILVCGTISIRTVIITVPIADLLLKNKTRVCASIKVNRGLPPSLKAKASRMEKGDTVFCRKDTGKKNRKTGEYIVKSVCINQYNVHMKRVKRADQYLLYYPILRKTMKWTKKVILYLINCRLFNCF
ncbi:uncharacterized protein LOC122533945 [Frieseomelitta varia]|uniref:uncharacterized protein LOC122533945 n=1 Tax=Frieseomelitta varia TaxID=561572 RepID=UPI001CB6AA78|nr:uncharacterized protein LOC122533945 [Frieseomelitta varia]